MLYYGIFVFFVYLLLPQDAWAWGPGAHLTYALHAWASLAVLAPPIRALLTKHKENFLYGSIAADIILGKKFAGDLYHCHHWDVAFSLLERAKSDSHKAFIYGYLGHLAVDTVAHNYFVPYNMIRSYERLTLRHTYWELRYDLKMHAQVWDVLKDIAKKDFKELDYFLETSLKKALFSFKTNKRIFDSWLLLPRLKRWRKAAKLLAERSDYGLSSQSVSEYKQLCCEVLVEFLQDPTKARVLMADPAGKLKLLYAKEAVRSLRRYQRQDKITPQQAVRFILNVRESLKEGIYKPVDLPSVEDFLIS